MSEPTKIRCQDSKGRLGWVLAKCRDGVRVVVLWDGLMGKQRVFIRKIKRV